MTSAFDALIFQVLDQHYATGILALDQILPMMEIRPLAEKSGGSEGYVLLRGEAIPVVDLRKYFGHARSEWPWESRIVIVNRDQKKLGLIVDRVREIQPVLPDAEGKMVRLQNGEVLQYLAPDSHFGGAAA